jgi:hypothetical protein
MPDVKGTALLPKGEANGFAALADELLKDPRRKRAALIIFDLKRGTEDYDQSDTVATVRIRRVELLLPTDLKTAELMLRRAQGARTTGDEQLEFEFEREIEEAFEAMREPDSPVDPEEGDGGDGEGKGKPRGRK